LSTALLTAFCDATILTGEVAVEGHAVLAKDGKILDIVGNRHVPADARKIACGGQILAPGLIDLQVNGGGNVLLNHEPTAEACLAIARAHRHYGTTRLLPTCFSDTPDVTKRAIAAVREARKTDEGILGIHLEGPHLGAERRGVHSADALRSLADADRALYRREGGEAMLITLAPENVAAPDISALRKQGIIVSLGHTAAAPEQIRAALEAGATGFTHLYNGMGGMSARVAGVAGIALDDCESWCSLIADGHHVAPEMIRLALRAKPQGKVFLVSDAMPPAATDKPQDFRLYGKVIHFEGGRCMTNEGGLAGSAITLLDAVRHCVQKIGVELDEALRMASTYPAAFLGVGHKLGKLLPGYEADVIALDGEVGLKGVWVSSKIDMR
jgi:N-acetylglucosamine-6-phosphate deacetylase